MSKCKTCAFMCKEENVKSCPTHEYSGIYVSDLEKRIKELEEAGGDILNLVIQYRSLLTEIVQAQFEKGFTLANLNSSVRKAKEFLEQ